MIGLQACQLSMLETKENMLDFDDKSEYIHWIKGR
jgi:hypothetical protein